MAIITSYHFAVDSNGKIVAGTVQQYDDSPVSVTYTTKVFKRDSNGNVEYDPATYKPVMLDDACVINTPVTPPSTPPGYNVEGTADVWAAQDRATYDSTTGQWTIAPLDPAIALENAKAAKVAALKVDEANDLKTFVSSALGSPHTYLSGPDDMTLLNGEYSFVKGNDYDGSPFLWYTVEAGNVTHTGAQFVQVYLDGRNNVQTVKYRRAVKEAQAESATAETQLPTIGWPKNPNPPAIPAGLVGTAGAAGSGEVTLTWMPNNDVTMLGGGGYRVYVDGAKTPVDAALVTADTYTVTGLAAGDHTFAITAVDTDGNESAACAAVTVTVA